MIFDEVITGFRFAFKGYQDIIGIKPDLTTMGKIIGGGAPIGLFGGREDIMEKISQAGMSMRLEHFQEIHYQPLQG